MPDEGPCELPWQSFGCGFISRKVKLHRHAHAGKDRLWQGSRVATVPTDTTRPTAMASASSPAHTGQVMGLYQVMSAPCRL